MSEVVERAVAAVRSEFQKEDPWKRPSDVIIARAVITSLREPTKEMIEAGLAVPATWLDIKESGLPIAREKMKLRWQAMIDEILK